MLLDYKPAKPFTPFIRLVQFLNRVFIINKVPVKVPENDLNMFRNIPRGASIVIAPNHADDFDPYIAVELSRRLRRYFSYMIARETFDMMHGFAGMVLQLMGGFSVVRGGDNKEATRYARQVLKTGRFPLLIFPEGEIYFLNDRIMPIKPGVALFALDVADEHAVDTKHPGTFIVPVGIKYRFQKDVTPVLEDALTKIELSIFGKPCRGSLYDRIYSIGTTLVEIKEKELQIVSEGDIYARVDYLRKAIIKNLEKKYFNKEHKDDDLERARKIIVHLMESLVDLEGNGDSQYDEDRCSIEKDLDEGWLAARMVSFAEDYLAEDQSLERMGETIRKLYREVFYLNAPSTREAKIPPRLGKQTAHVRFAAPIDVREYLPQYRERKCRKVSILAVTARLQEELQRLINELSLSSEL